MRRFAADAFPEGKKPMTHIRMMLATASLFLATGAIDAARRRRISFEREPEWLPRSPERRNRMHASTKRGATAFVVSASLLSVVIVAAYPPRAQAQRFDGFGPSFQYDQGLNPSVAVDGATVVEVHNGTEGVGPLWYRVGKVNASTVAWNDSHPYDNGFNPSVALNGTTVVEVHNGGAGAGPLWYRVGQVSGSTIQWNYSHQYDNGNNPSVALAGDTVVEVHNAGAGAGPMWYRMGKLNGTTITWSNSHPAGNGYNPSVGAQLCYLSCGVNVFEVHNAGGAAGPMWYRFGNSSNGSTISWQNSVNYDSGWNPKISFSGGNYLLEVHNGQEGVGPMWYHSGSYSPFWSPPIELGSSIFYDSGNNPSVAYDVGVDALVAIEVHNGGTGVGPQWYHRGIVEPPPQ
jgi:hypothetical protein